MKNRTFLVSMDVTSLYTNIPPNESIDRSVQSVWKFLQSNPLIPTHYPQAMCEESISNFNKTLDGQRLPTQFERKNVSEINKTHKNWKSALLKQNSKEKKEMSVPPSPYYKRSRLMEKWNLIQNQPLLCQRFTKPPIISHKKGKSWQRTCLLEPKY